MRSVFFVLLGVLPVVGSGQKLKKITRYSQNAGTIQIYHVLKSDTSVLQGSYKLMNMDYSPISTGFYKNGLKDSLWTEYDPISKKVFSKGYYSNGRDTGVCEYYDDLGELVQKYDYTNHQLLYNKAYHGATQHVYKGDTVEPIYIGGDWAIMARLKLLVRYPVHAWAAGIQGRVVIEFTVNTEGHANGFRVAEGVDPELDAEALRACQMIQDNWIPGRINGIAASTHYNLPVVFKLQ